MKQVSLTQGQFAIIDDEDDELVAQYNWRYNAMHNRAQTSVYIKGNGKPTNLYMHRLIMHAPEGVQVDHINGNRLDNQKANLRLVNAAQNQWNKRKVIRPGVTTSQYKGVNWDRSLNRWRARLSVNGKYIYLGIHKSEIAAALAYNEGAREYYGEYACLNTIEC